MLMITILWLPVLIIPLMTPVHGAVAEAFKAIDYTVWALFAVEYLAKLSLAPDRGLYFKKHVLDLIIVVVPFFRPLRLLRLLRIGVVFAEVLRRARSILTHNGFHFVVLAAAALVFVSAGLVTIAERNAKGANIHDFGQGLWWAITTVTTVGYGDRYPTTSIGQGVAVFLMLVGIGLIGVLTATIASYFVQERANATDERLDRIEALLTQLVGRGNGAVGEGQTPTDNGLTAPFTPTDSTYPARRAEIVRVGHARSHPYGVHVSTVTHTYARGCSYPCSANPPAGRGHERASRGSHWRWADSGGLRPSRSASGEGNDVAKGRFGSPELGNGHTTPTRARRLRDDKRG